MNDRLAAPAVDVGIRLAEFVTIDGLLHHLALLGVSLDDESIEAVATLRGRVTAIFGEVELVGLTDRGGARIALVFPDLRTMVLQPEFAHPSYAFGWGSVSLESEMTARALISRVWSRRWGPDEEMLVDALVHNVLSRAGDLFSFTANSLCEWCLLDGELETSLGPAQLHRLQVYESERGSLR